MLTEDHPYVTVLKHFLSGSRDKTTSNAANPHSPVNHQSSHQNESIQKSNVVRLSERKESRRAPVDFQGHGILRLTGKLTKAINAMLDPIPESG